MVSFLTLFGLLIACSDNQSNQTNNQSNEALKQDSMLYQKANQFFGVLPVVENLSPDLVNLGKALYFETALSANGKMSCNSCHMLDQYGVDNLPVSPGHQGKTGDRNSPSTYNAYFHFTQFWDGRAETLAEQAKGPILNPIEMGLPNEAAAVKNIKAIKEYTELFAKAFPQEQEPITYQNMANAIEAFEKTLRTPAPFDEFMNGKFNALSPEQKEGMLTFINTGCITCHMGPGIGAKMYQKFGLINGPYWEFTNSKLQDKGRAAVTNNPSDEYFFKVPSLRNVTETYPYFHDGSVEKLEDAINIMAKTQLGKELSPQETQSIMAFFQSLKGELPTINNPHQTAIN